MSNEYKDLLHALERNNELLTLIAKFTASNFLENEITDTKLKKLYELTGNKTQKEISKSLSMGDKTITAAWKRWESIGLLSKEGKTYRRILK